MAYASASVTNKNSTEPIVPACFAKVLIAFAIDFEGESTVSLAISANVLRLVETAGVRMRDLPGLCGISKEAIAMCCGFLERHGDARVGVDPSSTRFKVVTLTHRGQPRASRTST